MKYRNGALLIRILRVFLRVLYLDISRKKIRDNNTKCEGKRGAGTRRSVHLNLQVEENYEKDRDVVIMVLE